MVVRMAVIVVGMDHPDLWCESMNNLMEASRKRGMTGIETDPNLRIVQRIENPEDVADISEEQVGQLVFQHATYAPLRTAASNQAQRFDHIFEALEAL